ncbi:hypothetical protein JCM3766R1_000329 [Sporobolomyces carnicolor]
MTTRPFFDYDPALESALSSSRVSTLNDVNHHLPFTPPPSQPASSPGSPEYHSRELRASATQRPHEMTSICPLPMAPTTTTTTETKVGRPRDRELKARASVSTEHVEVSELPEGYGDRDAVPILPKTRISFPSVFLDDSGDEWNDAPLRRDEMTLETKKRKSQKTPRRRVVSQETVVETVSTRTLEKRKIRYSASILDEMEDDSLRSFRGTSRSCAPPSMADRASSSRLHADSPARGASTSRSPLLSTSSFQRGHRPTSRPRSSTITRGRRKSSSSVSRPPHSAALVLHLDEDSSASNNSLPPRCARDEDVYRSPLDYDSRDFRTFTDPSVPLFRPVVNLCTFLLVSSFCCLTVSAVLVTSFSLTFYDDCTRRLSGLNRTIRVGRRSIEGGIGGVRDGVGRVFGTARGAIEQAVRAAEGTGATDGDDRGGREDAPRNQTTMPAASQRDGDEGEESDPGRDGSGEGCYPEQAKAARLTSKARVSAGPGGRGGGESTRSQQASKARTFRRSLNPFTAFAPASSPRASSERDCHASGWATDEDALPFDVPHPTPSTSRPQSPHRSPRSRQPSSSSSSTSAAAAADDPPGAPPTASAPSLPPRPHLGVLLPSLFLAVVLTLVKLGYSLYKASQKDETDRSAREQPRSSSYGRRRSRSTTRRHPPY